MNKLRIEGLDLFLKELLLLSFFEELLRTLLQGHDNVVLIFFNLPLLFLKLNQL